MVSAFAQGQMPEVDWYSEKDYEGLLIQNSYPKGGPYPGPKESFYNHSYLVFYSRVFNGTTDPVELDLHFSNDSIPIPGSPHTFIKLFLPSDAMTFEKESLFSYGITELESLLEPTTFNCRIEPNEDRLFYVVAFFYQTRADALHERRGGNRAELVLNENEFLYNLPPQAHLIPCGQIQFIK